MRKLLSGKGVSFKGHFQKLNYTYSTCLKSVLSSSLLVHHIYIQSHSQEHLPQQLSAPFISRATSDHLLWWLHLVQTSVGLPDLPSIVDPFSTSWAFGMTPASAPSIGTLACARKDKLGTTTAIKHTIKAIRGTDEKILGGELEAALTDGLENALRYWKRWFSSVVFGVSLEPASIGGGLSVSFTNVEPKGLAVWSSSNPTSLKIDFRPEEPFVLSLVRLGKEGRLAASSNLSDVIVELNLGLTSRVV